MTTPRLSPERQRSQLLNDASSHGQYLWSNRDVENSLLWFQSSSSSSSSAQEITAVEKEEGSNDKQIMEEGYEFLRRLLHSPGILFERQSFKRNKRKQVGSSLEILNNDHVVTKRSDENKSTRSPLQSILKGYYRLMPSCLVSDNSSNDTRSLPSECMENDTVTTTTTTTMTFKERIQNAASVASSRLLTDIWSIIHARSHNVDIYQAYSNNVDRDRERQSREKRGVNGRGGKRMISFDEYMTLPPTCARVAYASCLYDKMIALCHRENCDDSTIIGVNHDDDDDDDHLPSQLYIFLHKLLGLAATNAKIREVIMLILLEPKRRSQVNHRDDSNGSCMSTKNVEIACTCPPLSTLVRMILRSNITEEDTIISMKMEVWWSLSSPLMCAISLGYLSIATEYIRHWIKTAVLGHVELYSNVAARVCSNDGNKDVDDLFVHAICRIIQFRSTSERLDILSRRALQSIEEDGLLGLSLGSCEREDEGEDTAFVISLAWKAIHRELQ